MMKGSAAPVSDLSTKEIVARIRAGDRQAYRHLVSRYKSEVTAVAHALLRGDDVVEDLVQQVFIEAFWSLESYSEERSFSAWIKGIARNKVREELRKKYRYRGRIEHYARLMEGRLAEMAGRDLFDAESRVALEDCLSRLDEKAARSIRMHYLEERSTEEIASILERSPGAVRVLMHRARAALRDCLVEKGVVA